VTHELTTRLPDSVTHIVEVTGASPHSGASEGTHREALILTSAAPQTEDHEAAGARSRTK